MSNSSLVSYTKLSPNYSKRGSKISKITIHHAAVVNASLEGLGNGFANPARKASSNYGIDSNGRIGMFVEEHNRAWTSSNTANDDVAITIEVANSKGAPNWEVSDKAYEALIALCVDICKRNNIKELVYTGDAKGNLTRHNMFAATTCPGPYLQSRFSDITKAVNKELGKSTITTNNNKPTTNNKVVVELDILRRGSKGEQVKTLQSLLSIGGYPLDIDGSFGPATEKAVIQYQKKNGLTADGIVGTMTWNSLLK
jgi:N-acetyl-anhydromuramyl-L-alanine amidase AmpD